jgi:hypothetical protein
VSLNRGDWELSALVCLLLGFALLVATVWQRLPVHPPTKRDLWLPVSVSVVAAVAHPVADSMQASGGALVSVQVAAAAAAVSVAAGLWLWPRWRRTSPAVTVVLVLVTGGLVIGLVRHPDIDVWAILQQSSTGLVHGDDLYRQNWIDGYGLKSVYPYLPWTTVLLAPFRLLFGDVRIGLLGFFLIGAWQLRRMGPTVPVALACLVLVSPHWAYYVVRSWTEPELMVLLFAALLALARDRAGWAMLWLGLALACKQPVVLLLPAFAAWPSFGWRRAIGSALIALVAVVPWLIAGPRDFWHDAVSAELGLSPLLRALSVPSGLSHAGIHVGFALLAAMLVTTYALIWWRLPRSPAGLALGCALILFAYDLANTQSFFNHYQLPAELIVAALALASAPTTIAGPLYRSGAMLNA